MLTSWRARGIAAGIVLALLVLSFLAGRRAAPAKVVTHVETKTVTEYRDRVQVQTVHDVAVQHDVQVQTRTVTVTKWAKAPDGTVTVVQEQRQAAREASHEAKAAETKREAARETSARQEATQTRTVTVEAARPAWSVTALAGGQFGGRNLLPGLPSPLVVGAAVERRIVGPIIAGAWATSSANAGLSLRVEF